MSESRRAPEIDEVMARGFKSTITELTTALTAEIRDRVALTATVAALTAENADIRQAAIAAWDEQEATMKALRANLLEVTAANERLTAAIRWALGENGEFTVRDATQGAYWWRNELRARAALPSTRDTTDG